MSYVTDVVLMFDVQENFESDLAHRSGHPIELLNRWLEKNADGRLFLPSQESTNGNVTGSNLWIGSFNQLDTDSLIQTLKSLNWRVPNSVQLLLKEEDADRAVLIDVGE